jgi:hypothetical protein
MVFLEKGLDLTSTDEGPVVCIDAFKDELNFVSDVVIVGLIDDELEIVLR